MSYSHLRSPGNSPKGHKCEISGVPGQPIRTFEGHDSAILCFTQLKDSRIVSGSLDTTIRVWDYETATSSQVLLGHVKGVTCVLQLSDTRLASGSSDKTIRLWDLESGTCTQVLDRHYAGVTCLLQLADGRLMSGGEDTNVLIWEVVPQEGAWFVNTEPVMLGRTTSGKYEHDGHRRTVWSLTQLRDGRVATGGCDGWVRVWDLKTDEVQLMLEKARTVTEMSDGRLATASYDSKNNLWLWDCDQKDDDGEPLPPVVTSKFAGSQDMVWGVKQLSDGRLMSYGEEPIVRIWNMKTDKCGWTLQAHGAGVMQADELPDGLILSCSRDKTMHLWQLPSK